MYFNYSNTGVILVAAPDSWKFLAIKRLSTDWLIERRRRSYFNEMADVAFDWQRKSKILWFSLQYSSEAILNVVDMSLCLNNTKDN